MIWKQILEIAGLILMLALFVWHIPALAWWSLFRDRGNQRTACVLSDGRIEFRPRPLSLWGSGAAIAYSIYILIHHLENGQWKPSVTLGIAMCWLVSLNFLFSLPETVAVTRDGLEQVYWLRKNKRIAWSDIVEINTGDKIRIVTIKGTDGTEIVHSKQHADRPRFLLELKRHCGENLPSDFPREQA